MPLATNARAITHTRRDTMGKGRQQEQPRSILFWIHLHAGPRPDAMREIREIRGNRFFWMLTLQLQGWTLSHFSAATDFATARPTGGGSVSAPRLPRHGPPDSP